MVAASTADGRGESMVVKEERGLCAEHKAGNVRAQAFLSTAVHGAAMRRA